MVAAPGTPFHGKAYWQATAQCGGIYFKLGTVYSDAAIRAKVVKPDPAAYAQLTKEADGASRTATAFFEAAERFLVADRKLARDEAVMTYDVVASGERRPGEDRRCGGAGREALSGTLQDLPRRVSAGVQRHVRADQLGPPLGLPDRPVGRHLDHAVAAFALGDLEAIARRGAAGTPACRP